MLNILWLLAAVFVADAINLNAKNILKVKVLSDKENLYFCGDEIDREFIVKIDIGEMTNKDSLYGYNFQIKYDSNAIELTDMLHYSTLSENCDFKQGGKSAPGYFKAAAVNMGTVMMTGNKPLIAIKGKVKDECLSNVKNVNIGLDYLEFTNEFIYDSLEIENLNIDLKKVELNKNVKARFENKNIDLNTDDKTIEMYLEIPDETIHRLTYEIDFTNIPLELNSDNFDNMKLSRDNEIETIEINDNIMRMTIQNQNTILRGDKILFDINGIEENFDSCEVYNRIVEDENECLCVNNYLNDTCVVSYIKNTPVDTNQTYAEEFRKNDNDVRFVQNDVLTIENEFDEIYIYDQVGNLIEKVKLNGLREVKFQNYCSGIYFGVERNKTITNKFIIIKY